MIQAAVSPREGETNVGGSVRIRELRQVQDHTCLTSPIHPVCQTVIQLITASILSWLTTKQLAGYVRAVIWTSYFRVYFQSQIKIVNCLILKNVNVPWMIKIMASVLMKKP